MWLDFKSSRFLLTVPDGLFRKNLPGVFPLNKTGIYLI